MIMNRRRTMIQRNYPKEYLTFEALENSTFSLTTASEYSLNGGNTWETLAANTETPTIHSGESILWRRGTNTPVGTFVSSGNFNVCGNIMSLLYGSVFVDKIALTVAAPFNNLFKNNTHVVNAENLILPATTLTRSCYQGMFNGCANLITAPKEIPDANMGGNSYCFAQMFMNCPLLTKSPILRPTVQGGNCYREMFRNSRGVNYVTMLATTITSGAMYIWLADASNTGTFVKKSGVEIPSGTSGIPNGWTVVEI